MITMSRGSLGRIATVLSACTIAGVVACSDSSTTPLVSGAASTISADRHGGGGGGDHGNKGDDNQNNNNNNNQNDNQQRFRLEVQLMAPAGDTIGAHGNARFESRGTEMELKVEVEHVPAGTAVSVFVGSTQIGMTAMTGAGREVEIELESKNGDTVPAITAGTVIMVKTAAGQVLASGTF